MIGNWNYGTGRRKTSTARVFLKSGGGNITMVPKMAITVGPQETWLADKVSIWHAGAHDNPLGQRLTALMISKRLADAAVVALKEAGANPQVFGVPTISDGMSMGTEGMKYSLISREVIADCVETCVGGQWMDGVLVIGGCDKNMPGGMMGMLRANVPAIYVYGGTILPGRYKGQDLNIVSVFEAVGQNAAGNLSDEDLREIEMRAIPGSGSCGGMYTANTMSSSFEALGMSLPFASTMAGRKSSRHLYRII